MGRNADFVRLCGSKMYRATFDSNHTCISLLFVLDVCTASLINFMSCFNTFDVVQMWPIIDL